MKDNANVYTVSRLNGEVRAVLSGHFPLVWVEGEMSNYASPASGHWYFTLKDGGAQVRCAMFRNRNGLCRFAPENGDQVLVQARVGLYEPRGEFQLTIEHMEAAGAGALQRAFDALKQKLFAEGLFDAARKKPIPEFPVRIGVISSLTGAALRDVLSVKRRRMPSLPVCIYPTSVQGDAAAAEIVSAIRQANADARCDILILTRGGGSLEDLRAFNDERVARAIAASRIPIVSGVGHEIDFTIADFVADLRAPTPSAAAELATPDGRAILKRVASLISTMERRVSDRVKSQIQLLGWLKGRAALQHPRARLQRESQRLDELYLRAANAVKIDVNRRSSRVLDLKLRCARHSPVKQLQLLRGRHQTLHARLKSSVQKRMWSYQTRLQGSIHTLKAISPMATLDRGYALVYKTGTAQLIRSSQELRQHDHLDIWLSRGQILAQVLESKPDGSV